MVTITQEDRHNVAARLNGSPMGLLDHGASALLALTGYCPVCTEPVEAVEDGDMAEFRISGMCSPCQVQVFGLDGDGPMEVATEPSLFEAEEGATE